MKRRRPARRRRRPRGSGGGAALGMLTGTVTGLGKAYYVCGTDPG